MLLFTYPLFTPSASLGQIPFHWFVLRKFIKLKMVGVNELHKSNDVVPLYIP